jgi:choline-sulfatase
MVRTGRYKYNCYNVGQDREELFDLERDPGEIRNLARAADYRNVVEDHRRRLREWAFRTRDDFPLLPSR